MKQIVNTNQAINLAKSFKKSQKSLVLVGGCFDILHSAHISFLKKAKKKGDFLFILLESDQNIKIQKGPNRPINDQINRAKLLSTLKIVDYVVLLPKMKNDNDYDLLINKIKPNIIAVTAGDKTIKQKTKQAKMVGAKILEVINLIPNKSTTNIINTISQKK